MTDPRFFWSEGPSTLPYRLFPLHGLSTTMGGVHDHAGRNA